MSESFSDEEKALMIEHMNDDHSDACLLYAKHHGGHADAIAATLTDIDRTTMTLTVTLEDGSEHSMPYTFSETLTSVEHAAKHLAQMAQDAR
ncbi:MAG: DUF2470 domain-containing protein [Pseudomonadota bacterium]